MLLVIYIYVFFSESLQNLVSFNVDECKVEAVLSR